MNAISYWRLKDRYYRLIGSCCNDCRSEFFPPVYICRKCGSRKIVDKEMPKNGTIMTYTMLREPMAGFEDQEPLALGIVKMENGVRILGHIVDTMGAPITIGDKVKVVFRRVRVSGETGQILYGYKFVKVK